MIKLSSPSRSLSASRSSHDFSLPLSVTPGTIVGEVYLCIFSHESNIRVFLIRFSDCVLTHCRDANGLLFKNGLHRNNNPTPPSINACVPEFIAN